MKDRKKLKKQLVEINAEICETTIIKDTYYTHKSIKSLEEQNKWYLSGKGFIVRTREVNNSNTKEHTVSIEVKKTDPKNPHVINFEREALCKSLSEAKEFLEMIDLKEFTRIYKTRILYKYKQFEITIDDIEGFGIGVEIELQKNSKLDFNDLIRFAEEVLKIPSNDRFNQGVSFLAFQNLAKF
ncbi:MAG: CYTH domain-containing protein [Candidatus Delongbacteria bacterium]|nr:CYTH domain-containing protein [Candidatus Delongbacteria bacterium]